MLNLLLHKLPLIRTKLNEFLGQIKLLIKNFKFKVMA